jgi:hypothetical protein
VAYEAPYDRPHFAVGRGGDDESCLIRLDRLERGIDLSIVTRSDDLDTRPVLPQGICAGQDRYADRVVSGAATPRKG